MFAQRKVQGRYPDAVATHQGTDEWPSWAVWSSSTPGGGRGLLGQGYTEAAAWEYAVRTIERQEGRTLTCL